MEKIRLLLSGNTNLQYYMDAVNAAGGEATAKYLPDISTDYDGLILCGGNDIDPKYYHQEMNGSVNIDSQRDTVEFALLKAFVDAGKPVLGICRGHQLINVFFGGSLHQDLPEKSLHTNRQDLYITHCITAKENSMLCNLYGPFFVVNSSHHQAVNRLDNDLIATAYWNDTYIEGFEHCSQRIYGVQWHPERMCVNEKRADTVDGIKILNGSSMFAKKIELLQSLSNQRKRLDRSVKPFFVGTPQQEIIFAPTPRIKPSAGVKLEPLNSCHVISSSFDVTRIIGIYIKFAVWYNKL